jgi:hypothetical protein
MEPSNDYVINVYPEKNLPGINTYVVVTALQKDLTVYGILAVNYVDTNRIIVYHGSRKNDILNTYATAIHIKGKDYAFGSRISKDYTTIFVDVPAKYSASTFPITFELRTRQNRVALSSELYYEGLTKPEMKDYEFLKKNSYLGTFRVYCQYTSSTYSHSRKPVGWKNYDLRKDAIPDVLIDTEYSLKTISELVQYLKSTEKSISRYTPYLQAKLIYQLGMYEDSVELSAFTKTPIKPVPDELRNDVLRYLENALHNNPHPLLQYHYAIYAMKDLERSTALFREAAKKTDDEYLKMLAENALKLIENFK